MIRFLFRLLFLPVEILLALVGVRLSRRGWPRVYRRPPGHRPYRRR